MGLRRVWFQHNECKGDSPSDWAGGVVFQHRECKGGIPLDWAEEGVVSLLGMQERLPTGLG